jgi:hypothetical protein
MKKCCGYNKDTCKYSHQRCSPIDAKVIATMYGCPINAWDVSNVQDFSYIFSGNRGFNETIGLWNVSQATSMSGMVFVANAFNQDISLWDVLNVRDMSGMFEYDLLSWNASNEQVMNDMFWKAISFNQDITVRDTSNVINMPERNVLEATSFNQIYLDGIHPVCSVQEWMQFMFEGTTSFQQDVACCVLVG